MNAHSAKVSHNYRRTQVESASPEKLVLLLYEGAIRKLEQAKTSIDSDDEPGFHTEVVKVQKIISELLNALDIERGGEVSENLFRLYEYMLHRLGLALVRKEKEPLEEVQSLLDELRGGWEEAVGKASNSEAAGSTSDDPSRKKRGLTENEEDWKHPVMPSLNIAG